MAGGIPPPNLPPPPDLPQGVADLLTPAVPHRRSPPDRPLGGRLDGTESDPVAPKHCVHDSFSCCVGPTLGKGDQGRGASQYRLRSRPRQRDPRHTPQRSMKSSGSTPSPSATRVM